MLKVASQVSIESTKSVIFYGNLDTPINGTTNYPNEFSSQFEFG